MICTCCGEKEAITTTGQPLCQDCIDGDADTCPQCGCEKDSDLDLCESCQAKNERINSRNERIEKVRKILGDWIESTTYAETGTEYHTLNDGRIVRVSDHAENGARPESHLAFVSIDPEDGIDPEDLIKFLK